MPLVTGKVWSSLAHHWWFRVNSRSFTHLKSGRRTLLFAFIHHEIHSRLAEFPKKPLEFHCLLDTCACSCPTIGINFEKQTGSHQPQPASSATRRPSSCWLYSSFHGVMHHATKCRYRLVGSQPSQEANLTVIYLRNQASTSLKTDIDIKNCHF